MRRTITLLCVVLTYPPFFERIDAHAVRYRARDMVEATRTFVFILNYEIGLTT